MFKKELTKEERELILRNLKTPGEMEYIKAVATPRQKVAGIALGSLSVAAGLVLGLFITVLVNTKPANEYDAFINLGEPYCDHVWQIDEEHSNDDSFVLNCTSCTASKVVSKDDIE